VFFLLHLSGGKEFLVPVTGLKNKAFMAKEKSALAPLFRHGF
jgi:hypothetical protein